MNMEASILIKDDHLREIVKEEAEKLIKNSVDGCWWDMKRLEAETCRKRDWLIENILLNPSFRNEMKMISNGCEGGRWMFRGDLMRSFLAENFHHLNRKPGGL